MKKYLLSATLLALSYNANAAPTIEGNTLTFPGYYYVYEADTTDWSTYACTQFSDGPSCMLPDGEYLWGDGEDTGRVKLPAAPPPVGNTVSISEPIRCSDANHITEVIDGGDFLEVGFDESPVVACSLSCPMGEHIISVVCNGTATGGGFPLGFVDFPNTVPTGITRRDSRSADCSIYGHEPYLADGVFPREYNVYVKVNASALCMSIN